MQVLIIDNDIAYRNGVSMADPINIGYLYHVEILEQQSRLYPLHCQI